MSRRWDDDDEELHDRRPVFKGSRNYESFGSSFGETLGDVATAAKNAAANLKEQIGRNDALEKLGSKLNDVGESIKQTDMGNSVQKEWKKVTAGTTKMLEERRLAAEIEKERSKSHSKMPPGCYCDMRGFACPLHKGHEKWRTGQVYQQHLKHNLGGNDSSAAVGGGSSGGDEARGGSNRGDGAGDATSTEVDEMMAQLVGMGFDPERVRSVLSEHKTLQVWPVRMCVRPSPVSLSLPP